MWVRVLAGVAAVAALAGCGSPNSIDGSKDAAPPAEPAASSAPATGQPAPVAGALLPSSLVGQWAVAGNGIAAKTVLNLTTDGIEVFQACGLLDGAWAAGRTGTFLAELTGGDDACFPETVEDPTPAWIAKAVAVAGEGNARRLLDAGGQTLATLTPGNGGATVEPLAAADAAELAVRDLTAPALPAGLRPATTEELIGFWTVPGATAAPTTDEAGPGAPGIEFMTDRMWGGSDGCSGMGGLWALAGGVLLATQDSATADGCTPVDVMDGVVALGFAGDQLVVIGTDGNELRRLTKEVQPADDGEPADETESPTPA